jgi:hypothetical protein
MKPKKYINQFPKNLRCKIRQDLAKTSGVTEVYIRNMFNGHAPFTPKVARTLEIYSAGQVRVHESCPKDYPKPYEWRE